MTLDPNVTDQPADRQSEPIDPQPTQPAPAPEQTPTQPAPEPVEPQPSQEDGQPAPVVTPAPEGERDASTADHRFYVARDGHLVEQF